MKFRWRKGQGEEMVFYRIIPEEMKDSEWVWALQFWHLTIFINIVACNAP